MNDQALTTLSLLAFGLVMVAVEVFVIPGFGLLGAAGGACLLLGSVLTFIWFGPELGSGALLLSVLGPALLMWLFTRSRAGKQLVLSASLRSDHDDQHGAQATLQVGQEGRALSPLRPSGTALFATERVDVVTDGQYVDAGEPLRICEIAGARVVVEKITRAEQPTTT